MTGHPPPWVFAVLAFAAAVGMFGCAASLVVRSVLTGGTRGHGGRDAESVPALLFLAVAMLADTFQVVGA